MPIRTHHRLLALTVLGLALLLTGLVVPAGAAADPVTNVTPPTVSGTPAYRSRLTADPGTWSDPAATFTYQWRRDGQAISGATGRSYVARLADIGHDVAVQVTATGSGGSGTAVSDAVRVRKATLVVEQRPGISGTRRYLHTLTVVKADWKQQVDGRRYQWLRDGRAITDATRATYRLGHLDVGHRISVRETARKEGYVAHSTTSPRTRAIGHRVPLRRTVYYHVETRGRITTSLADFKRLANASLNDPRGWRVTGIAFKQVASGGSMTLVLAEASRVPRFSSECSAEWSCRVGRYVIINQKRWKYASPAWNDHGGSLRGYRHMVVNHETGHWLGHGHRSCPRRGALAPVMQQQSKSLQGCRFNPFPTKAEWTTPRFG